jgi:hypothetical protein
VKIGFSGFSLGNREKIAVVANAEFYRQQVKLAEKMKFQEPTSNLQGSSKVRTSNIWNWVLEHSLVPGTWGLDVPLFPVAVSQGKSSHSRTPRAQPRIPPPPHFYCDTNHCPCDICAIKNQKFKIKNN